MKRFLIPALWVLFTMILTVPCFAQEDAYVFDSIAVQAQVQADGNIVVEQTMDVNFTTPGTGFAWKMRGEYEYSSKGTRAVNVTATGDLPAQITQDGDAVTVFFGSGMVSGKHTVTLSYTLERKNEYDPTADYLDWDFFGHGAGVTVHSFTAEIAYPGGAEPILCVVTDSQNTLMNAEDTTVRVADGIIQVEARGISSYARRYLMCSLPQGTFAYETPEQEHTVKDFKTHISIGPEMVYTVKHEAVVETLTKNAWISMPVIEFEDYDVKYTAQVLASSANMEMTTHAYAGRERISVELKAPDRGEHTVEYSYTMRPRDVHAPIKLRMDAPYWQKVPTENYTLTIEGAGFEEAVVDLRSELRLPKEARYTLVQDDKKIVFTLVAPLLTDDALVLEIPYDKSYYARSVGAAALGTAVFAAFMLLVVLGIKFLFGMGRKLRAVADVRAPKGVSVAEFGYLLDGVAKNEEIVVLLLQWATQGLLQIEQSGGEYIFKRTGDPVQAAPYEQMAFEQFFACGNGGFVTTVQLRGSMPGLISTVRRGILMKYRGKMALRPIGAMQIVAMVMAMLPVGALGAVGFVALGNPIAAALAAVLGVVAQVPAALFATAAFAPGSGALGKARIANPVTRWICCILLIVYETVVASLLTTLLGATSLIAIWGTVVLSALACCVAGSFLLHTAAMHALLGDILGFGAYVRLAPKDTLCAQEGLTAGYSYEALPYAIAMGTEQVWCDALANKVLPQPSFWVGARNMQDVASAARPLLQLLHRLSVPGGQ